MMTACVHSAAAVLYINSMKFQSGPWLKSNELLSIFEVADSVRMATEDNYHYGTYTDVCVCVGCPAESDPVLGTCGQRQFLLAGKRLQFHSILPPVGHPRTPPLRKRRPR